MATVTLPTHAVNTLGAIAVVLPIIVAVLGCLASGRSPGCQHGCPSFFQRGCAHAASRSDWHVDLRKSDG